MPNAELPNEAPANINRDTSPGIGIGRQIIDPSKEQYCQEFSRAELTAGIAQVAAEEAKREAEEAKRLDGNNDRRGSRPNKKAKAEPPDPFKRVTFAIDNKDFAEYVGHKPTPEPLENLYDTTTLQRIFALRNPDGTPRKIFVWQSWMWMPAALLVGASFIVGGYFAMKPRKHVDNLAAVAPTPEPLLARDGATSESAIQLPPTPPQPAIPSEAATAEGTASPMSSTPPIVKSGPKSAPKRVQGTTPNVPSTPKENDDRPKSAYERTPFTPLD